jgi:hypothetical protein
MSEEKKKIDWDLIEGGQYSENYINEIQAGADFEDLYDADSEETYD